MTRHTPQIKTQADILTRFTSLPLELRQQIVDLTITPFKRPEAPLGYIVDPLVAMDFRTQRDEFQKQMQHLQDLGSQVTSDGYIENITEKWREQWESCMASMISEDEIKLMDDIKDNWPIWRSSVVAQVPKDVNEYVEETAEWFTGGKINKKQAMHFVLGTLRNARMGRLYEQRLESRWEGLWTVEDERPVDRAEERYHDIDIAELRIVHDTDRELRLQKALSWEEE